MTNSSNRENSYPKTGRSSTQLALLEPELGIFGRGIDLPQAHGVIRTIPEDFQVDEILNTGDVAREIWPLSPSSGLYTQFLLVKRELDTPSAIRFIAENMGKPIDDFGYAGLKDARAVTTQRVSAWKVPITVISKLSHERIRIFDPITSRYPVRLGDCYGNRFRVVVRRVRSGEKRLVSHLLSAFSKKNQLLFPNFFGPQRFGVTRPILHLVGKAVVQRDFERAVLLYMVAPYQAEPVRLANARDDLMETNNLSKYLKALPRHLAIEQTLASHLIRHPGDFRGALAALPGLTQKLIIGSYQSYLFNLCLSKLLEEISFLNVQHEAEILPIIGRDTDLSAYPSRVQDISNDVMELEGVSCSDFYFSDNKKWMSKGTLRRTTRRSEDFEVECDLEDQKMTLEFTLQKGSYATIMLREIFSLEEALVHSG